MNYTDRITMDPGVMLGKPVIKGTRITVKLILRKLSEGMSIEQVIKAYPQLSKEDIYAALAFATDVVAHEEVIRSKAS